MELRLEPSTSSCIETVAKREYERVLSLLLKGEQVDKKLEEELELLKLFLESADFGKLRRLSEEHLIRGKRVEFILRWIDSIFSYKIEVNQFKDDIGWKEL